MYEGGADIVYHAAGGSGAGVFDAAAEAGDGKWAIGVDSDQYLTGRRGQKPHILTSMLKRVDTAVFDFSRRSPTASRSPATGLRPGQATASATPRRVASSTTSSTQLDDFKPSRSSSGDIKVPTDSLTEVE